jgi:enoyl-CoA hydratase/carnithine racemase
MDIPDLHLDIRDHIATVEIARPPHNFFDFHLIRQLADTFEALDRDPACRAIVLCSQGKSFCAGANFGDGSQVQADGSVEGSLNRVGVDHLYIEAVRLFAAGKPVVGAIQGAAIGGGLGLAMVPDFRVGCPESRFAANFTRLGFHPGFGLTTTLPRVIGRQKADLMFLTSRRIRGDEAFEWGLLDILTTHGQVRETAWNLAREIAVNAPLGVTSTRATLRLGLADAVRAATDRELQQQTRLRKTEDFKEGVAATHARRDPDFTGR